MEKNTPNFSGAWQNLAEHCKQTANLRVAEQLAAHPERFAEFSLQAADIFLDYSKNRLTPDTLRLLCELAQAAEVPRYREEMFSGAKINNTEGRQVLHTALRNVDDESTPTGKLVNQELQHIAQFVNNVYSGKHRGTSGKTITDVVNIGIGGSDLGPAMVVSALKPYALHLKTHFVSNLDATHINETIKNLNAETTLFIISSKTFTTQETLVNAQIAKQWLLAHNQQQENALQQHLIGVTANPQRATAFGIKPENIFPFWDWVGGRFSLWSAIGISIALAIGIDNFYELLRGAQKMDQHFRTAPLEKNMPIILALLGIWNINFLQAKSLAIIPYDQCLSLLPSYLQQLEMESNGKRIHKDGTAVDYTTAPIVWGATGTNSQHSFHQLLMQGTHLVPIDFIIPLKSHYPSADNHLLLYANCLAQSQALMCGCQAPESYKVIPGNVPSNTIILPQVTPAGLGALLALYEHKVFVQGIIWQINSFDQWGVELGKNLAGKLTAILRSENQDLSQLDSSTAGLVALYQKNCGQDGFLTTRGRIDDEKNLRGNYATTALS